MKETLEGFYNTILGIESPWQVVSDSKTQLVTAQVYYQEGKPLCCPACGAKGKLHDHQKRK